MKFVLWLLPLKLLRESLSTARVCHPVTCSACYLEKPCNMALFPFSTVHSCIIPCFQKIPIPELCWHNRRKPIGNALWMARDVHCEVMIVDGNFTLSASWMSANFPFLASGLSIGISWYIVTLSPLALSGQPIFQFFHLQSLLPNTEGKELVVTLLN